MYKSSLVVVVSSLSLLIGACGGGGSDSGNTQHAALTPANAPTVSSKVAESALTPGNMFGQGSQGIPGNSSLQFNLVNFVDRQVKQMPENLSSTMAGNVVAGIDLDITKECSVSGSFNIKGNIADPTTGGIASGNKINIDFDNCKEAADIVVDGGFGLTFQEVTNSGGQGDFSYKATVSFRNFVITQGNDNASANGDMTLTLTKTGDMNTWLMEGSNLSLAAQGDMVAMSSYEIKEIYKDTSDEYTVEVNGDLEGASIGGAVNFMTVEPFTGFSTRNPSSGSMKISGNKSSVTLTAVDEQRVTLEVDTDGDGQVDETISTTWQELEIKPIITR